MGLIALIGLPSLGLKDRTRCWAKKMDQESILFRLLYGAVLKGSEVCFLSPQKQK